MWKAECKHRVIYIRHFMIWRVSVNKDNYSNSLTTGTVLTDQSGQMLYCEQSVRPLWRVLVSTSLACKLKSVCMCMCVHTCVYIHGMLEFVRALETIIPLFFVLWRQLRLMPRVILSKIAQLLAELDLEPRLRAFYWEFFTPNYVAHVHTSILILYICYIYTL